MLPLVLTCLGILLYTYVGYPILIGLLARLFPRRQNVDASYEPTVTVCIPAYNVASYLDAKLQSVFAQDYPGEKLEVLVYSDASDDGTDALVQAWQARDPRVVYLRGERRAGKPTALNTMAERARGELLFLTDARQRLDPGALRALVGAMSDPNVGCATGNLVLEGNAGSGVYWRYENWIRLQESRFRSVVGMTGPIAMVRRRDFRSVPRSVILDDVLVPMRLRLAGQQVVLVEAAKAYDAAFEDGREFGRKARTLAGNYQIFAWMPELLVPWRNPSWFETVSHKVLRLVCPWLLVLLFLAPLASLLATNPQPVALQWVLGFLAVQIAFYGAALLGASAGRLGSLARTFVMMNWAAQVGLFRFLSRRQRVTW